MLKNAFLSRFQNVSVYICQSVISWRSMGVSASLSTIEEEFFHCHEPLIAAEGVSELMCWLMMAAENPSTC